MAVRFQLSLGWNTYFRFHFCNVNFVWKTDEGEAKRIALLGFLLWRCFNRRWVRVGEGGAESFI